MSFTPDFVLLAFVCALLTYATRVGGYLILSRFDRIPPRAVAALDAVPAAVMTTLFAPLLLVGWREALALVVAILAGMRFGLIPIVALGTGAIILLRALG